MSLTHVLAANGLGTPLDDNRLRKAIRVLQSFGFREENGIYTSDELVGWMSVREQDGLLRVHARSPLPAHVFDRVVAALDGVVKDANLARIEPIRRREISAADWAKIVEEERKASGAGK